MDAQTRTEELLYRLTHDEVYTMQTFLKIVDENKRLVPFRIKNRPMQQDFVNRILVPKRTKAIELKARRVGGTSLFMALAIIRCHLRRNYNVLLLAQSDPDGKKFMNEGFERFYDNMIPQVKMPDGSIFRLKLPLTQNSDHEMSFAKTGSKINVATAGSVKLGRGQSLDMVIGTEVARWDVGRPPGTAEETWSMVEGALGDKPDALAIQESTAYGAAGFFYDTYQGARKGENGFEPLFYSWLWHPVYTYEEGDNRAHASCRGPIDLTDDEIRLGITIGQARWRRTQIKNLTLPMFLQEYPEDDETCFRMSGDPYFEAELVDRNIREARPALSVGQSGRLKIWQAPRVGESYVIGVDVGGAGTEVQRAEQERDYDAAVVLDSHHNHVATLHGRWDTRDLAELTADLGEYYNMATIVPESGPYGEAYIQAIGLILGYQHLYVEKGRDGKPKHVGIHIHEHSKPVVLEALKDAYEHGVLRTDDKDLLSEMRNYHRCPTPSGKTRLEARAGHDDLVIAAALAAFVIGTGNFRGGRKRGVRIYYPDGRMVETGRKLPARVPSLVGKDEQYAKVIGATQE